MAMALLMMMFVTGNGIAVQYAKETGLAEGASERVLGVNKVKYSSSRWRHLMLGKK